MVITGIGRGKCRRVRMIGRGIIIIVVVGEVGRDGKVAGGDVSHPSHGKAGGHCCCGML